MAETRLHTETLGSSDSRFVFLHGLFGRGRNWASIARNLQPHCSVLVDLPNHGLSPWSPKFSYLDMVADVVQVLAELGQPACLVGHSMGGRVAMLTALHHPDLVDRLVIVDTSPGLIPTDRLRTVAQAMSKVDMSTVTSRSQVRRILARNIDDELVVGFLLQNLTRDIHHHWSWTLNLDVLNRDIELVGEWPETSASYCHPTLFITGAQSDHDVGDLTNVKKLFPLMRQVKVKQAGHWVHADAPEVVTEALRHFVAET